MEAYHNSVFTYQHFRQKCPMNDGCTDDELIDILKTSIRDAFITCWHSNYKQPSIRFVVSDMSTSTTKYYKAYCYRNVHKMKDNCFALAANYGFTQDMIDTAIGDLRSGGFNIHNPRFDSDDITYCVDLELPSDQVSTCPQCREIENKSKKTRYIIGTWAVLCLVGIGIMLQRNR
jgi:hypothetical protein